MSHDLCDGYAKGGEAIQDGDPDLELRDLTIKVPRGQSLAQQFDTVHLGFDLTRLRRWQPLHRRQIVRPKRLDARKALLRAIALGVSGFHGLAFFRGGMMAADRRAAMASWHLRMSKAPSAMMLAICR